MLPNFFALFANSTESTFGFYFKYVFGCVFVSLRAMGFVALVFGVFAMGYCAKMFRILATLVSAFVVNIKSFWNLAIEQHIRRSVCAAYFSIKQKFPVSVWLCGTNPIPASRNFIQLNFLRESLDICFQFVGHNNKKTRAPKVKPASDSRSRNASRNCVLNFITQSGGFSAATTLQNSFA